MPNVQKNPKERESKQEITRIVKQGLILSISLLCSILIVLWLRIGESMWPFWMLENRTRIVAILLLAIICVVALSPIMIEASSNTRSLSGPGKNPEGPRLE